MKTSRLTILSFFIFLSWPFASSAYETSSGTSLKIEKEETKSGNLYSISQDIIIEGTVQGDLACMTQSLLINGTIEGDLLCAAQNITINGQIKGDARLAANNISINGQIDGNTNLFAQSVRTGSSTALAKDLFLAVSAAELQGKIDGSLHGMIGAAKLNGEINKDIKLRLFASNYFSYTEAATGQLEIGKEARFAGNLYYSGPQEAKIDQAATIKGAVGYTEKKSDKKQNTQNFLWNSIFGIFTSLVVGLFLVSLFRQELLIATAKMSEKRKNAIGRGLILMFIPPFAIIILIFTIIGIPLALIMLALWLIALYLAKIFTGILLGQELLKSFQTQEGQKAPSLMNAMIIGTIVLGLFSQIVLLGWFISLMATWWGLGGIWLYIEAAREKKEASN